jgi:uncharacterized protein YdaU (DUF1376 family)
MKIRRIDFSPDEFIAGTMELSDAECGLYWRLCSLIYSRGRSVSRDELRAVSPSHGNAFNALLRRLIAIGKVIGNDADLIVKRCGNELEKAEKRIRKLRENGEKGGRPTSKSNGIAKPAGLFPPRADIRAEPSTTNHQLSKNPLKSPKGDDGFDDFWQVYPKKVGKQDALKAWPKAIKAAEPSAIVEGARSYAASHEPSYEYWKNPSGWLNGKRWQDQPIANGGGNGYAREVSAEEHEAARLQARREAGLCADD